MIFRIFAFTVLYLAMMCALYAFFIRGLRGNPARLNGKPMLPLYFEMGIVFVSLYLQLYLAILTPLGDSHYFVSIINRLLDKPFFGLYAELGITYPPLFNYIYYVVGQALRFFGIPIIEVSQSFIFVIKIPGILCSLMMSALIYRAVSVKSGGEDTSAPGNPAQEGLRVVTLAMIMLNPACIFISSYISQIDALYSFFVLLTVYLLFTGHLKTSYFTYAAAVLLKFQALFIAPVLLYAIISQVCLHDFSRKRFLTHLFTGLGAIACMVLSYLPFIYDWQTHTFARGGLAINFTKSVASYGFASQNAYNFWALTGYNWKQASELFGPLSCDTWGTVFIVLIVIVSAVLFVLKRDSRDSYPLLGALLVSGIFLFSVKMMPRYLYPAVLLLILGYALKPTSRRFLCALAFSVDLFLTTTFDYLVYPREQYSYSLILPYFISIYGILCFGFLIYTIWTEQTDRISG